MNVRPSLKWVLPLVFTTVCLSGCAEVRKIVAVVFGGKISVSTQSFEITEMSSGNAVTCNIMGDKTVRCVGSTTNGNLGRFYGEPITALKDVKQVSLGKRFSCVISGENSALKCFGSNDKGQLGNPNVQASSVEPVPVLDPDNKNEPMVDVKFVATGENHACAIVKGGKAVCWGDNSAGQIGNQNQEGVGVKTVMDPEATQKPMQNVSYIAAGGNSTCIVAKEDKTVFCFGEKYNSTVKFNWEPKKVEMAGSGGRLNQAKQVGIGQGFACALSRSQVYCWGANALKQLGSSAISAGATKAAAVEVRYPQVGSLSKIDAIAVGDKHTCALHRDELTVYCWGDNTFGQLGTTSLHGAPEQVALGANNLTLKGVKYLAAGRERTCIVSNRDELFCWGNGAHGLLGNEHVVSTYPTRAIDPSGDLVTASASVAVGYDHTCVIGINQKLYCFGINEFGQLGTRLMASPVVSSQSVKKMLDGAVAMDTHGNRTCVVFGEKKGLACFGGKEQKELSVKRNINSFTPEEILSSSAKPYQNLSAVSVGNGRVCIIGADTQVECIDGKTTPANHEIIQNEAKNPLKDIWQIRSKVDWNCGLTRESGEIWCWGDWKNNHWANAKQISYAGKPSREFIQISLSEDQLCAIHGSAGALYCTPVSETPHPYELQAVSDAQGKPFERIFSLTAGKHHMCAMNDKNHLYCWGSNEFGQMGITTTKSSSTPLRVTIKDEEKRKLSRASAGDYHTCFNTFSELSLFCFGKSFFNESPSPNPIECPL